MRILIGWDGMGWDGMGWKHGEVNEDPAGPIIPVEPRNNSRTKYTKMESKMNQNGTGSRISILVSTFSMVKTILGFHWYHGTSWRSKLIEKYGRTDVQDRKAGPGTLDSEEHV